MNTPAAAGGLRKVKRANYLQILNETVRDTRISYRALGILTELLSHEEGWVVRAEDLGRRRKEGREAVASALRELAAAGYYRVERRRDPSGKFTMGTAIADYPVPEWVDDFKMHPRGGVPVRVAADGTVTRMDGTAPESAPDETDSQGPGDGMAGSGFPGSGYTDSGAPDSGDPRPLEDQSQNTIKEGSAALRAATAEPVETSSSNVTLGNARGPDDAAAAMSSADDVPGDASRAGTGPAAILEAMMLNPDEAARFRAWLVTATNATNPDGLIVTLHTSGRLSERLTQWRTSEDGPGTVNGPTPPRVVHLEWCGRCDQTTRTASVTDQDGREYIRRCPTCNIHAGRPAAGSGASQEIAQQVALAAANSTGGGRDAAAAARAALPQGIGRRSTTIGTPVDVAALRAAQGAVQ